jgi:cation-transporting ATPase E
MTDAVPPAELDGLTAVEVSARVAEGHLNVAPRGPSRTMGQILRANILNPVNAIMLTLFAAIMIAGFWRDGLFVGVVLSNTVIGIAQELRARRELRRLEILNAPRARVRRDGATVEIDTEQIVIDDVIELSPGDQVVVDAEILAVVGLELDESLLTGESDTVHKAPGDKVLSGSFVVAGTGWCRATGIGDASYANQLTEEATTFKLARSELRSGINTILRWLIIIIPPACLLLLWSLVRTSDRWQDAVQGTVAAAVAMVPDGLVLLTSLAFVAGVIALARREALAKELATVELLARVDTLCLDKTGTITTGEISFSSIESLGDNTADWVRDAVAGAAHSDPNPNPTLAAIKAGLSTGPGWEVVSTEPFSSARKWAGTSFTNGWTIWIGAPEILFADHDTDAVERAGLHAASGRRVLGVAGVETSEPAVLASGRSAIGLVVLEDTVRHDAAEILDFFNTQGVDLRVISGDNIATVAAVAERAGVRGTDRVLDARTLPEDRDELAAVLPEVMENTVVFGRVTPHQKRAMVHALQRSGRTVAMTGDGVNDVLALKDADMGIAMGSGSPASRSAADLVLLDNRFATLPIVLAQGRKVISNIERVANLFVTKAVYAVLITAMIGVMSVPFPLLPRQLTLIGTFSIGVPGFFLALAPNDERSRPGFLNRVLRFSIPAGVASGLAALGVYAIGTADASISLDEARSATAITLLAMGLVILILVSRPLRWWKVLLAMVMALCYTAVIALQPLRDFFEMSPPPTSMIVPMIGLVSVCGAAAILAGVTVLRPEVRRQPDPEPAASVDSPNETAAPQR